MTSPSSYEPVIGLEVHAQLRTASKAFCACSTSFGDAPNTHVCPVCLGMPGVLPVLNRAAVECAIRMGLATQCSIAERSVFARKNYFYPDLPKGYQISQYEEPLCRDGSVEIESPDGTTKIIGIARIHLEEDAGKSIHEAGNTVLDMNRCGVPLIEIVSKPDLRSPQEASLYMTRIRQIVTYLGICDGNMEEGSLRCDANVSVRRRGEKTFGTKTEVKNLNSFRFVEKALEYEIERQIAMLERGETILQETLLWDAGRSVAVSMRSKEEAHDYRYFPEPDLLPVLIGEAWVERVRGTLPESPAHRRDRYVRHFGLPKYDANLLTAEKALADYFESTIAHLKIKNAETWKIASNWMMTEVLRVADERHLDPSTFPVSPERFAAMLNLIVDGTISGTIGKEVFEEMLRSPETPEQIVERKGLTQVSDTKAIEEAVDAVLAAHPEQVQQFLGGKKQVFGFLVGETMKSMKGKANPKVVNDILLKKLHIPH